MSRRGRPIIHDERGVTLLELVISLTVAGILLPVLAAWLIALTTQWSEVTDRIETRQRTAVLLHRMGTELREGSQFSPQLSGLAFRSGEGRLIRYQLTTGGLLLRDEEGVGSTVIGSRLSDCRFTTEQEGKLVTIHLDGITQTWAGRGSRP